MKALNSDQAVRGANSSCRGSSHAFLALAGGVSVESELLHDLPDVVEGEAGDGERIQQAAVGAA